jgi:FkbM family methyltransferase
MLKAFAKRQLSRRGYSLRHVGARSTVSGVDLIHDIRALLGIESPLVFDIGANVGQTIDEVRRTFGAARILSFEPSPKSYATLCERYPDVRLEPLAISDSVGEATFHVSDEWSVNDSLQPMIGASDVRTVTVQTTTVDAYCATHDIPRIDWLKSDTQGHDLKVLRGAATMLAERAIQLVSAEVNFAVAYEGQHTMIDLLAYMEPTGYQLMGVYDQTFWRNRLAYCNLLWIAP